MSLVHAMITLVSLGLMCLRSTFFHRPNYWFLSICSGTRIRNSFQVLIKKPRGIFTPNQMGYSCPSLVQPALETSVCTPNKVHLLF